MFANNYKKELLDAILEMLWKQWTHLGIAGHISDTENIYVLDPEALLVFSSFYARYDQRLFDLITDWLQRNGERINIPRLKAILKKSTITDKKSLGVMAGSIKSKKWQTFAKNLRLQKVEKTESLFLSMDGSNHEFVPHPDETALRYGFLRNRYIISNKVISPPAASTGTLLLRLRGAFGLSARAEAILAMLNQDFCRIQDIADCGKFSWKTASDVLEELYTSGIINTQDNTKRGRVYFLNAPQVVASLFGIRKVAFPDWHTVFNAIDTISQVFNNPHLSEVSERSVRAEIQSVFAKKINNQLHFCRIPELAKFSVDSISELPKIIRMLN